MHKAKFSNFPPLIYNICKQVFKRNKIPLEIKAYAIACYAIISSCRKCAKKLAFICKVSKSSVNYWVRKFANALRFAKQCKEFRRIAVDETEVKLNGKIIYVYAAVDVDTKEILAIEAYANRNTLNSLRFLRKVLKFAKHAMIFIDRAPWLINACKILGVSFSHGKERNCVERLFGYLKHRARFFFCNINARLSNWNLMLRIFEFYYAYMR